MGRNPCCSKEDLNRGAWTSHEDQILTDYIKTHGQGKWREVPEKAGLKRCGKSCRLRWLNYLRPDIKRGNITPDEEELIIKLHKLLGNRWSLIAGRLPGRTDNEIKNYWNTNLGKRVESTTSPTLPRNQSQSRKKKCRIEPSNVADEASPKAQTVQVVRTKAHRCKKLFLPPKPEKVVHEQEVELKSYSGLQPYSQSEEYYRPSFMTDLNVRDFCISGLLDSDFSRLSYLDKDSRGFDGNNKSSSSNDLSVTSDTTMLFNGGMFDHWRRSDCVQYSDQSSSDLHSLPTFLDPEEGWLGE